MGPPSCVNTPWPCSSICPKGQAIGSSCLPHANFGTVSSAHTASIKGKEGLRMLLQQLLNGLAIGITYSLVAVGFTLVYGVLQLVNFAHGAFYLLGAYLTITFTTTLHLPLYVGLLLCVVATGLLGALMDTAILKPIRKTDDGVSSLIATLGIGTVVTNLLIVLYGSETKSFPDIFSRKRINIGPAIIKWNQIFIAMVALVIMLALCYFVYKTTMGSGMRAISQNPVAAQLMGIPVNKVISTTFFVGTMCAAIAGNLVASYYGAIDTTMYLAVSLKTFASAVLGGVGSIPGAMLAGIIIGVLETLVAGYISSDYREAVAFIILIVVLIFRPSGLFGQKNVDKA